MEINLLFSKIIDYNILQTQMINFKIENSQLLQIGKTFTSPIIFATAVIYL